MQEIGVASLGVDDSFFDLGGDSLAAEATFAAIEHELGASLPTAVLLEHPTIAALARRIRDDAASDRCPVLVLRPHGSRPPFFCVDAIGGGLLVNRRLVTACPPDQPVYALTRHRYDPDASHDMTIEGLARDYVDLIRRVRPSGPYYIGGFCAAGAISLEIARQLESISERVDMVLMVDTTNRQYYAAWRRAVLHLREAAHGGGLAAYMHVGTRMGETLAWATRGWVGANPQRASTPSAKRLRRDAMRRALNRHVPRPCARPVTLVVSASYRRRYGRHDLGWGEIVPELTVVEIEGTHSDAVRGTGLDVVSRVLERAQETTCARRAG